MLGKLFGGGTKEKENQPSSPVLSMVLCASMPKLDADAIAAAATQLDPKGKVTVQRTSGDDPKTKDVVTFHGAGAHVMMMPMPGPVPGDDIEAAHARTPFWPEDEPAPFHEGHVVMMAVSDDGEVAAAMLASRVALAMMEVGGGVAWYVGGGSLLHKAQFVREVLTESIKEGSFPTPLWVNLMLEPAGENGERVNACTVGMDELGQREFEVLGAKLEVDELAGILIDVATYTLLEGPVLKHGETFGRTPDERWRIEVGPSKLGIEGAVTRLKMP